MEKCVKENLLKLGNSVQRHRSLKTARSVGEKGPLQPEHNKCQEVISQIGQRSDWRCLRLQRGSAFVLESMRGPLSGLTGGGTWSDGCLRKMTLAAVCIQDSKPFYSWAICQNGSWAGALQLGPLVRPQRRCRACSTRHTTQVVAGPVPAAPRIFTFLPEHVHQPMVSIFTKQQAGFQWEVTEKRGWGIRDRGNTVTHPPSLAFIRRILGYGRLLAVESVLSTSILDFLN